MTDICILALSSNLIGQGCPVGHMWMPRLIKPDLIPFIYSYADSRSLSTNSWCNTSARGLSVPEQFAQKLYLQFQDTSSYSFYSFCDWILLQSVFLNWILKWVKLRNTIKLTLETSFHYFQPKEKNHCENDFASVNEFWLKHCTHWRMNRSAEASFILMYSDLRTTHLVHDHTFELSIIHRQRTLWENIR